MFNKRNVINIREVLAIMTVRYTNEKNTLILIALLKAHRINKVVASPGATNISFVSGVQSDPFFTVYSAADERSAAYIACGLAEESGEPVVITCTGATASRNYLPALTEAYYRKLPILAVTATMPIGRIGQLIPQNIDRSVVQNDIAKKSVYLCTCYSKEQEWICGVHANDAILELTRNGGGPVHINLETVYSKDFSVEKLPNVRPIFRIETDDAFPSLPRGNIGIFVGAHSKWNDRLTSAVDKFCKSHNAVVLCDQTSNYRGAYRSLSNLVTDQVGHSADCNNFDLIIHIGNVSGAYLSFSVKETWRVNPDGEVRDTLKHLHYVFQMREEVFFEHFAEIGKSSDNTISASWQKTYNDYRSRIPELPLSNIWFVSQIADKLPSNSVVHLGILNTLRSWNFFETPSDVLFYCNTGGFGIDGVLSSAVGASLFDPSKLYYCFIGDLAFFYDMNALGNRHVSNNLRVVLVNNGKGTEFRNYNHRAAILGEAADLFVAAAGHYGAKSPTLAKHYAEDLGFEYIGVYSKDDARAAIEQLIQPAISEKPLFVEIFTDSKDESDALYAITHLFGESHSVRGTFKKVFGRGGIRFLNCIRTRIKKRK